MRFQGKSGLTFIEIILVLVIAATLAGLAAPNIRIGMENRQAKQAVQTLRSIHHAVRMYQLDKGGNLPADILSMENQSYVLSTEFAVKKVLVDVSDRTNYVYSINTADANWYAEAKRCTGTGCATVIRTLRAYKDGSITDDAGILNYTPPAS